MADSRERLAILISGSGTTMAEMVNAIQSDPRLQRRIEIAAVISSKLDAGGINKAKALGVPNQDILVVDPRSHRFPDGRRNPDGFGDELSSVMKAREVTVFTQNGWIPQTPKTVIDEWRGYNQHPGDPRDFGKIYGMQVHAAALRFSDELPRAVPTFAIAHEVIPEIDGGAIVLYESVIMPKPTTEDALLRGEAAGFRFMERAGELQQAVLPREHAIWVRFLHNIADGSVHEVFPPRVVFPGEEMIRDNAKQFAVRLYPHG